MRWGAALSERRNGWTLPAAVSVSAVRRADGLGPLPAGPGRRYGPLLVAGWGVGLIGAGLFTADPVSGYPAGTPDLLPGYGSTAAAVHDTTSLIAFLALAAAYVVFGRRFAEDGRWGRVDDRGGIQIVDFVAIGVLNLAYAWGLRIGLHPGRVRAWQISSTASPGSLAVTVLRPGCSCC